MQNIQTLPLINLELPASNRSTHFKRFKQLKRLPLLKSISFVLFIVSYLSLLISFIRGLIHSSSTKLLQTDKELLDFLFYPFQSDIIESIAELELLRNWIAPSQKVGMRLIYKATVHEDSSIIFHRYTDKNTHYLILMKTLKARFGGYTSRNFCVNNFATTTFESTDRSSFLLSLTHKRKWVIDPSKVEEALTCDDDHGPVFGNGDIVVPSKFLQVKSTSKFPKSFIVDSDGDSALLTGNEKEFQLIEMEVFQIAFSG